MRATTSLRRRARSTAAIVCGVLSACASNPTSGDPYAIDAAAALRGRLTDLSGQSVARRPVTIRCGDPVNLRYSMATDADGSFAWRLDVPSPAVAAVRERDGILGCRFDTGNGGFGPLHDVRFGSVRDGGSPPVTTIDLRVP